MARTLAELVNTTQSDLFSGFIDTLLKTDEFTAALIANAGVTDKPSLKFNRLASVPTPVYADCDTSFTSQAVSGGPVTVDLLTMAVQFNVCQIGQNLYSSYTDVVATEVEGALKGLSHKILADSVGSGNGSSAIYGLDSVATNTFAKAGASVDVGDLDDLGAQRRRLLGDGDGVHVHHAEDAVIAVLVAHPVADRTQQVAQVDGAAGRHAQGRRTSSWRS